MVVEATTLRLEMHVFFTKDVGKVHYSVLIQQRSSVSFCLYDCFAMVRVCVCVSYGSETSSYSSECRDDEEIALAIHAAEVTARHEARSRFKNAADLIHRLFVCISGHCDLISFTLCYICYL